MRPATVQACTAIAVKARESGTVGRTESRLEPRVGTPGGESPGSDPRKECADGLIRAVIEGGRSPTCGNSLAAMAIVVASLAVFEGCAPVPLPHYAAYRPKASRRIARRLGKPPAWPATMGTVLVPRPAVAPDAVPDPRRPRSLINALDTQVLRRSAHDRVRIVSAPQRISRPGHARLAGSFLMNAIADRSWAQVILEEPLDDRHITFRI